MNSKKRAFIPDITVSSGPRLNLLDIRNMAQQDPKGFMVRIQGLIKEGKLGLGNVRDLRPLYAALADLKVPVEMSMGEGMGTRTIDASAFPLLTGTFVIALINDSYMAVPTIGQELVREIDDPKKMTFIAAVHASDNDVDEVKEKEDFPEIGATEEKAVIMHKRNGRRLTITQEAIEENEIPNIVMKCNALGEIAADSVEELTIKRVCDYDGSCAAPADPYVYRPNGVGTPLFSATAKTPGPRATVGTRIMNNPFTDETALEKMRTALNNMRNMRGKRIAIPMSEVRILFPDSISGRVNKVLNSEYVPGIENEVNNWGPRGMWQLPPTRRLTTPKLDDLSTGAWYYGAPQKQFIRKWKLRFEYMTLGSDTESYLKRRIAFQARIAWDVEVGATDYVYWLQALPAEAAPKDGG